MGMCFERAFLGAWLHAARVSARLHYVVLL